MTLLFKSASINAPRPCRHAERFKFEAVSGTSGGRAHLLPRLDSAPNYLTRPLLSTLPRRSASTLLALLPPALSCVRPSSPHTLVHRPPLPPCHPSFSSHQPSLILHPIIPPSPPPSLLHLFPLPRSPRHSPHPSACHPFIPSSSDLLPIMPHHSSLIPSSFILYLPSPGPSSSTPLSSVPSTSSSPRPHWTIRPIKAPSHVM